MNLIEKIKTVVENATGLKYYYDTPNTLNNTLDNATYPCVFSNILHSGTFIDKNGCIHERIELELRFADKSDVDFDGIKAETTIDTLKKHAFSTILAFYSSGTIRVIRNINTNRYYATNDVVLCGYGVTLEIEEIEGVTTCN